MAGFFPLFFKQYWSAGFSAVESTYMLGLVNSIASFALALSAPALGAIADQGGWRKPFLFLFTVLGIAGSLALGFIGKGEWFWAMSWFALGMVGFTGAQTFYDALLVQVAERKHFDRVSGLGYALGYLGGGVLFAFNVWMFLKPETFGIAGKPEAVKISFITVAIWWFLFSLPVFFQVPERAARMSGAWRGIILEGFRGLARHARALSGQKPLFFFLLGFLFYNDAVNTIMKMAVDYGLALGLESADLIKALLLVQFIGFPAAIAFGFAGEKIGPLRGIAICLCVYLGVTVYAYFLSSATEFFIMAAVIGLVQGGVQALSRSYYARLVPPENSAEYFGFFNMIGKFSSVLGPLMVGWVGLLFNDSRAGILILAIFFVLGGGLLFKSRRAERAA